MVDLSASILSITLYAATYHVKPLVEVELHAAAFSARINFRRYGQDPGGGHYSRHLNYWLKGKCQSVRRSQKESEEG